MRHFLERALNGDGSWVWVKRILIANAGIYVTTTVGMGQEALGVVAVDYAKGSIVWMLENWRFVAVVIGEQYKTWLAMVHEMALQWLRKKGYRDPAQKHLKPKD